MHAIQEIGIGKAIRYLFGQLQTGFLKCALVLPPVRKLALQLFGATIGEHSIVQPCSFFNVYRKGFSGFALGHHCFIGDECLFDLADEIQCGDHVTIAERVVILTHVNVGYKNHPLQKMLPAMHAPVSIGSGSFVGVNSTILAGIKIGERSIVAAGSVVLEDVSDDTMVAGVPARVIRSLLTI